MRISKLKIVFISPWLYPCHTGGMEIFNYHLIRELSSQDYKIWVISSCDYNWNNKNVQNLRLCSKFPALEVISSYFFIIFFLLKLKGKFDLIHVSYTSNSSIAYPILFIYKLCGIKYVITIHGGGMYKWKPKIIQQLFFKNANDIIAVSETIKIEYEKRSSRKIKMILPLIPFSQPKIPKIELRNKYRFNNDDIIILTLGSIKKIKGSDVLLEAFFNLGKEYVKTNKIKLLYVGDGRTRNELEKKVYEQGFTKDVKFFGNVSYNNVPNMYKLADIYVIPSLFEGTPKSLLEAMFNGLPCIGSDTNGINNIIMNNWNGLLFKVADERELCVKLKTLIENESLRKSLGKNAMKSEDEKYNYEKTIKEFIEIYNNILTKKMNQ